MSSNHRHGHCNTEHCPGVIVVATSRLRSWFCPTGYRRLGCVACPYKALDMVLYKSYDVSHTPFPCAPRTCTGIDDNGDDLHVRRLADRHGCPAPYGHDRYFRPTCQSFVNMSPSPTTETATLLATPHSFVWHTPLALVHPTTLDGKTAPHNQTTRRLSQTWIATETQPCK